MLVALLRTRCFRTVQAWCLLGRQRVPRSQVDLAPSSATSCTTRGEFEPSFRVYSLGAYQFRVYSFRVCSFRACSVRVYSFRVYSGKGMAGPVCASKRCRVSIFPSSHRTGRSRSNKSAGCFVLQDACKRARCDCFLYWRLGIARRNVLRGQSDFFPPRRDPACADRCLELVVSAQA